MSAFTVSVSSIVTVFLKVTAASTSSADTVRFNGASGLYYTGTRNTRKSCLYQSYSKYKTAGSGIIIDQNIVVGESRAQLSSDCGVSAGPFWFELIGPGFPVEFRVPNTQLCSKPTDQTQTTDSFAETKFLGTTESCLLEHRPDAWQKQF